jgi:hypothetical protein
LASSIGFEIDDEQALLRKHLTQVILYHDFDPVGDAYPEGHDPALDCWCDLNEAQADHFAGKCAAFVAKYWQKKINSP